MRKNGFVQIIVIILVVLAIIVGVYYFGVKNKSIIGQYCGGIAGVSCPENYFCKLNNNNSDTGGVCIKK